VIEGLRREVATRPAVFQRGVDFLLHAVLDGIADRYLDLLDDLDAVTYDLERRVMSKPEPALLEDIFMVKRKLLHLVRFSHLQREVVHRLSREPFAQVGETARWYFRDVYDHLFQVSGMAEFYRDTVSGVRDAYLSVVSNRLNESMKVLTAFASVLLPLTVVTGIYGMNFDRMPELHWRFGYPAVLLAMGVMAIGLLVYFRRRGWW
jgi:magnesium transporter